VESRIRAINPYARVHRTERCDVPIQSLLGQGAFDLQRILAIEPEFLAGDHDHDHHHGHDDAHHHHNGGPKHYHDEEMQSLSLKSDKPIDPDKFLPWINDLVAAEGPKILRCKGIISFKDDPQRFVLQGVHMVLDGDHQRDWKADEKRQSRLVFIGRELDAAAIERGFLACVV
jgi:G3E family GTPase